MPANARVVPSPATRQILLTATVPTLQNAYEILRDLDLKSSASQPESAPPKGSAPR